MLRSLLAQNAQLKCVSSVETHGMVKTKPAKMPCEIDLKVGSPKIKATALSVRVVVQKLRRRRAVIKWRVLSASISFVGLVERKVLTTLTLGWVLGVELA